jgi:hypothetical protein
MENKPYVHTAIVGKDLGIGYLHAGYILPGVSVEMQVPRTPEEKRALITEHVGALVHIFQPQDEAEFRQEQEAELAKTFDPPFENVFIRATFPDDNRILQRIYQLQITARQNSASN